MKGVWRKTIGGLKPADALAEEVYQSLPLNCEVMADVTRSRNLGHHRKFYALAKLIRDNQDHYKTTDDVVDALKIAVGHCYPVEYRPGNWMVKTKSISWAKMDQSQFNEFWNGVVSVVITKFLPGVDSEALEAEILTMVS